MLVYSLLFRLLRFLLPASIVLTAYLYTYPLTNRCAFPSPCDSANNDGPDTCMLERNPLKSTENNLEPTTTLPEVAPFRLLALGDPQLEGDSSLPDLNFPGWNHVYSNVRGAQFSEALRGLQDGIADIPKLMLNALTYARKQIDLFGNDYYLAHIYRSMTFFTRPTHVTVLGDLLGSQWIDDNEFGWRTWRYWNRVFNGAQRVPPELLGAGKDESDDVGTHTEPLGADSEWSKRLISVAGNHDIGYAGDINSQRLQRFEREYGPVNGDIIFTLNFTTASGDTPALRLLVLNSMNLDGPALEEDLRHQTYEFLNSAIVSSLPVESHHHATILLSHIPLHKESGICVDDPFFDFYEEHHGSGVKEQNMLSRDLSRDAILHGIFGKTSDVQAPARGLGRDGIILTGHDHEGCDVYHYVDRESGKWEAARWRSIDAAAQSRDSDIPGIREVTVRSMMGEFGGNVALLSAWWDENVSRWRIEVSNCPLGVQHIWWAIHILDLVVLLLGAACFISFAIERHQRGDQSKVDHNERGKANGGTDRKGSGVRKGPASVVSAKTQSGRA